MRVGILGIAGAAALALAVAACGGESEPEPTPTPTATPTPRVLRIPGELVLFGSAVQDRRLEGISKPTWLGVEPGEECSGYRGYDDIAAGMEVRVEADGRILSLSRLSTGVFGDWPEKPLDYTMTCTFAFEVEVPEGHQFYTVALGRRGEHNYTWDELVSKDKLSYYLGR